MAVTEACDFRSAVGVVESDNPVVGVVGVTGRSTVAVGARAGAIAKVIGILNDGYY
jgi:hypothetical protein